MSITTVKKNIKAAMKDSFITEAEAKKIVKDAERGPVTIGEAKLVADLFDRGERVPPPPGMMVTLAIPEHPGDVIIEGGASTVLQAFFEKNKIPAGAQKQIMLERIDSAMAKAGWGEPLDQEPDTKKLFLVRLPYPEGAMDFPTRNAFVDLKKGEFYLSVSGGLMPPGVMPTRWYGPTKLGEPLPAALRGNLEDNARDLVGKTGFALTRSDAVLIDTIKPNAGGTFDVVFKVAHFLNQNVRARVALEVDGEGNFISG